MTSIQSLLLSVSRSVVPSRNEESRMAKLVELLLKRTETVAKDYAQVTGVVVGGSYAKGTWLPGEVDIDIFVKIDPSVDEDDFERIGLEIGRRATEGYPTGKKYAQHPYTEAIVNGVKVNVVPCYDVKEKMWKSAADRSPYHVKLISSLSNDQKLQIRLLKKFMKAIGVYGAELETEGFSGYAAEVLVMKHSSLLGVLEYFADLKQHSAEKLYSLPDPVDENRDLARAISGEKIAIMVLASRKFLSSPSKSFFSGIKYNRRRPIEEDVIAVVFTHSALSEDTLWGGLKSTLNHLVRHVEGSGFKVSRSVAASDNRTNSAFLILPETSSLPKIKQRVGPPVFMRSETESFILKNRKRARLIWVSEDARINVLEEREYTSLVALIKDILAHGLESIGASPAVASGLRADGRLVRGRALQRLAREKQWLREGLLQIASDTIGTS